MSTTCHTSCHPPGTPICPLPVIPPILHLQHLHVPYLLYLQSSTCNTYMSPTCHTSCPHVHYLSSTWNTNMSTTCHTSCHPPVTPTCPLPVIPPILHLQHLHVPYLSYLQSSTCNTYMSPTCHTSCPHVHYLSYLLSSTCNTYMSTTCHTSYPPPATPTCPLPVIPPVIHL